MIPEALSPVKFLAKTTGSCSASPPGVDSATVRRNRGHTPESLGTCRGFKTFWTIIKNKMENVQSKKNKRIFLKWLLTELSFLKIVYIVFLGKLQMSLKGYFIWFALSSQLYPVFTCRLLNKARSTTDHGLIQVHGQTFFMTQKTCLVFNTFIFSHNTCSCYSCSKSLKEFVFYHV